MSSQKIVTSLTASNVINTSDLNVAGKFVLKGVSVFSPRNSKRVKIPIMSPGMILAPYGPLEEAVFIFPESEIVADGTVMYITVLQDIKKVSFTNGNFANMSQLGPYVKAGDSITLFYHKPSDKWYKLAGSNSNSGAAPVVVQKSKAEVVSEEV